MRFEEPQVKAPPVSRRRRMRPPTPMQSSYSSFEEEQGHFEEGSSDVEVPETERSLERSYSVKVEIEELESLLGRDDVDVDFRRILKEARDERGCETFETFSTDGLREFLVAEWSRWDKYKRAPRRQDSSASTSEGWWREDQEQPIVGWSP